MRRMHLQFYECVLCGGVFGLTLHHVTLRSQGGSDSQENLIWLCHGPGTDNCHGRYHDGDERVRAEMDRYLEGLDVVESS